MSEQGKHGSSQELKRNPTPTEQAGMTWWNGLNERGRAYWLKRAGTAIPAEAWACYQAAPKPLQKAIRVWDGIRVEGQDFAVQVTTSVDGGLRVTVDAMPSVTGFSGECRLTSSDGPDLRFGLGDIKVDAASLECFAPNRSAPLYREGFKLVIESHMAQALRAWLPKLADSAVLAQAIATVIERELPVPVQHLHGFTCELAARVVLDELPPDEALKLQCESHWAGTGEPQFVAVFHGDQVQHLLTTAAFWIQQALNRVTA